MDGFVVGQIVKTRGLAGCVKAVSFLESSDIFDGLEAIYVEQAPGQEKRFLIRKASPAGRVVFLEFQGVTDVDTARQLVGGKLLLPREFLSELPPDEYYWRDLIGLEVQDEKGATLGRIESIFPTGSNDVFVCRNTEGEILIPSIADVVLKVDIPSGIITVRLPQELLP